jgi:ATP-dependent DNA ligase
VRLVYYAFDLLHLDGQDISGLQLVERKALLEPLVAGKPAFSSAVMRAETANSSQVRGGSALRKD